MESEHNALPNQSLSPEQIEELYQQFAAQSRIEEEIQRKHHQLALPNAFSVDSCEITFFIRKFFFIFFFTLIDK